MKKTILSLALTVFVASTLITSCSTPAQKVENAQDNVTQANLDLDKAQEQYQADVEQFRKETNDHIAANEASIADFNLRIENEKKQAKADYKAKIAELEQRNTDLRKRMDDYRADNREKWEHFKTEFNNEMTEVGKSIGDLVRSKK